MSQNIDKAVVAGFGDEWSRFDQSDVHDAELTGLFDEYFGVFPWNELPDGAVGFDLGCGSGRWAKRVSPRVGTLHLIDASSEALEVARRNLSGSSNCVFHHASVDQIPLEDESCDFGYSLGVLHHVPNTEEGLRSCVAKLRKGAPFLLYLYYAFDNRPFWYRWIWLISDFFRQGISRLPFTARASISSVIAVVVYWPCARLCLLLEKVGLNVDVLPLSQYRHRSLYVMRTDALDRFGTRLEQRFTKEEIESMMKQCGLTSIRFSEEVFWAAVGVKV